MDYLADVSPQCPEYAEIVFVNRVHVEPEDLCFITAVERYRIPIEIATTIIYEIERGWSGAGIYNSSSGTCDYGKSQINSVNLTEIETTLGYSVSSLVFNECSSINASLFLLRKHLDEKETYLNSADNNEDYLLRYLEVVARYHSKTPEKNRKYQELLINGLIRQ